MTGDRLSAHVQSARPELRVRRRHVFYIPGFDPIHPRRYRELYRKEGAEQAKLIGYGLSLLPKSQSTDPEAGFGWQVRAEIEGETVETQFEVLTWSDIVRANMGQGLFATYMQLLRTAWAYIGSGALFALMKLRKGPMIAALYPVFFLLFQMMAALSLGAIAGGLVTFVTDHFLPRLIVSFTVVWLALRFFRAIDHRIFAWYLMHDYAFSARHDGANPPELDARLEAFTARIEAKLDEDLDEVLVIGHSSGAHLAVMVLADLLRRKSLRAGQRPELSFLSLGQVVPMVSFLPKAQRLRGDLRYLSTQDRLFWLDVTAPGDGCAFALCDPVSVSGVATPDKVNPLVISAAFTQTLSQARWKALRRRWFRLHFQYLCAFDALPGREDDYDYFRLSAGPQTLRQRYGARQPSKSRIETPLNIFRSVM